MALSNYMSRLLRLTSSPGGASVGAIGMIVESTPSVASAASIIGSYTVSSIIPIAKVDCSVPWITPAAMDDRLLLWISADSLNFWSGLRGTG